MYWTRGERLSSKYDERERALDMGEVSKYCMCVWCLLREWVNDSDRGHAVEDDHHTLHVERSIRITPTVNT